MERENRNGGGSDSALDASKVRREPPETGQPNRCASELDESFGLNAGFVAEIRERYQVDPESVDPTWQGHFEDGGVPSPREHPVAAPGGTLENAPNGGSQARASRLPGRR